VTFLEDNLPPGYIEEKDSDIDESAEETLDFPPEMTN